MRLRKGIVMSTAKITKFLAVVFVTAAVATASQANAAKVVKPAAPTIIKATPVSVSTKYAKIRVLIEKAPVGVTRTVVSDGFGAQCTIPSKLTSCVMSKVQVKRPMRMAAVSWAGTVKGARTGFLMFNARSTWVHDGYSPEGVKYPAATNAGSLVRLLGTTTKWTKFQALKRSGVSSAGLHQAHPRAGESSLIFQVSGIVGLALASSNSSCGVSGVSSGVACAVGVNSDGTSTSIYAPGSTTPLVKDFYSAPNGKIYVVFNSQTPLVQGGSYCIFAEVNTDTGVPTCVDAEMGSISMSFGYSFGSFSNGNSPVQFDSSGAVYYTGTASVMNGGMPTFSLRKFVNGTVTKLVTDNITMRDFVVLGDGTVILAGMTSSTQVNWLRRLAPGTGSITSLVSGSMVTFLRKFADGNVYWGVGNGSPEAKVERYLAAEGKVDDIPWMAGGQAYGQTVSTRNDLSGVCPIPTGPVFSYNGFCSSSGSMVRGTWNLGTTRTVAFSGGISGLSSATYFMQYYPTVIKYTTIVTNVTIALQVGQKMVLTGTNAEGKNILTIFDTETFQESVLLDGSNEVEIYSLGYVPSTNKVMFNGLSFANNQYQVGDITLP